MSQRYDVAIIGCGEAGIYASYELMKQNPGLRVVVLEQGRDIYNRSCPIVAGKVIYVVVIVFIFTVAILFMDFIFSGILKLLHLS